MLKQTAEVLNNREFAVLTVVVDTLLPGGDGFPPASAVGTVGYMMGKMRPSDMGDWLRPGLAEIEALSRGDFLSANEMERAETLQRTQKEQQTLFERLLALTYYSYYAQPAVVDVIRRMGFDYNHAPQPLGYTMAPFDPGNPAMLPAQPRGHYKGTGDVDREVLS